jgi:predicted dinucleotide-binding enzyme
LKARWQANRSMCFVAGDDDEAKEAVAQIVPDGGLRAIDVGPLERARQLDRCTG